MISIGNLEILKKMLLAHEGYRQKPYHDTVGKLTIGIGRNLDDVGINEDEAFYLLANDIRKANDACETNFPFYHYLDEARKCVLIEMVFSMGIGKVLQFKNMLSAIESKDWNKAAEQMLDSQWARQVGQRAKDLTQIMRTGILK